MQLSDKSQDRRTNNAEPCEAHRSTLKAGTEVRNLLDVCQCQYGLWLILESS